MLDTSGWVCYYILGMLYAFGVMLFALKRTKTYMEYNMRKTLNITRKSVWMLSLLFALALFAAVVFFAPSRVSGEEVDAGISTYADESGFVVRDNLVYDGTTYDMTELNALLYASGEYITSDMTAAIVAYTDPVGVEADINKLPDVIHDAGTYTIRVAKSSGAPVEFSVNIARANINLANYDNLSWRLTEIAGEAANAELLNGTGMALYIYTDNSGNEYPSVTELSATQLSDLGLGDAYTVRTVLYSVVRNRYKDVTITVVDNDAYSVAYEQGSNVGNAIGRYDAAVTLTASKNYTFSANGISNFRGMTVSVDADRTTADVTKTWYIVDMGNWLVTSSGDDYSIADRVFGDDTPVAAPALKYGDDSDISMRLLRNGTQIGSNSFGVNDFADYINSAMPAGDYELIVTAAGVYSEETDDEATVDPENPVKVTLYRSGFTESIVFTVDKAVLPSLDAVNAAIKGKTFVHMWVENASHLYDFEAESVVNEYIENRYTDRDGTVWEDYDELYSDSFSITFNLASMQSDAYYGANDMTVAMVDPDRYTVYYKISAPNYYSSIDNLDNNDVRQNYFFEVVNVRAIEVPTVLSKTYNGSAQVADVADNLYYTVTTNNGGTAVGQYNVVFTLRRPDFYMWEGQTLDRKTESVTVKFEITKSANEWLVEPTIQNWVEGKFDADDNAVVGSSLFGFDTMTFVVTDTSVGGKVLFDSAIDDLSKLNELDAGNYFIKVTVAGTDSYNGLTSSMLFRVFKAPGIPVWSIVLIILGVVLIIAIVLFVLIKKGVFQILTGRLVLAIRTKATVDATIAAVRAAKQSEALRLKMAEDERNKQQQLRAAKAAEQEALPIGQKAAALEEKARKQAERAEKMKARSEAMMQRAARMKEQAGIDEAAAETPVEQAEGEAPQTTETPAEN